MESRQTFSREFQALVVSQVASGKLNKESARLKYGIKGKSAILNWQRKFAQEHHEALMARDLSKLDRSALQKRIVELEKSLEEQTFRAHAFEVYTEELQKEIRKNRVKKFNTEQSANSATNDALAE